MDDDNEIAIVGLGCRFPGADNADEFWQVLVNGENHVNEINNDRWNHDAYYSENKDEVGKYYVKKAGFLKNHDEWDHKLFGVSDSEAGRIDPQQRYVLECTHMAMEDGGITREGLKGSQTGVYIGVMNTDYKSLCEQDGDAVSNYCATGKSTTIIASRVSYTYDLRGPCMVIDTACSSAMTAIHLGSQALKSGDCTMAICGGVSSIVSPASFLVLCKTRMMSSVGQCQAFCDTADGYARGEGCGVVILKTVKRATEDKNKIWAILRTGCNQDGHAAFPITAPSGEQQENLLRQVYTKFSVDPMTLQYIEMHGTGTPIGDPTEVNAVGKFIKSYNPTDISNTSYISKHNDTENKDMVAVQIISAKSQPIIKIGSVKTNIGHTESAAGVASLIKVVLMMKNGKLVPSLHIKNDKSNLNEHILLDEYSLDVVTNVEDWAPNKNQERIACINSFGFGGSNSHSIVIQKNKLSTSDCNEIQVSPCNIVCISAMDKIVLRNNIERFREDIQISEVSIADVSYTSAFRRDHYKNRTIIYGKTLDEITEQAKFKVKNIDTLKTQSQTRLVFVFCGVGTTWDGMCAELFRTQPVFNAKIQEIDTYLEPLSGLCIADKFKSDKTDYSDPFLNHISIFCTQVALFALWEHWGVLPDAVVGQSVGEVAAAVASHSLSLKDGVNVIYCRSKELAEITDGKMMVVGNLPVDEMESICSKHNKKVDIAVYNSPVSCTLTGDADVMDKIKEELDQINEKNSAKILIRPLCVQCAYHSYHVEPCLASIESKLNNLGKETRITDQISTVTGELTEANEFQSGKYWADNIRKPVRFMQALLNSSVLNVTNVFLEVGPRQVLNAHLTAIMTDKFKVACLPSMNAKKENSCMYSSLSELYEMGVSLNWNNIVPMTGCVQAVPTYCFNKTKTLHVPEKALCFMNKNENDANRHMFVRPNSGKGAAFRICIDKHTTPFVFDHFMQNTVLVPGATYIEAAFEIGEKVTPFRAYNLAVSVEFSNPLTISDIKRHHLVDIEVTAAENNSYKYTCFYEQRTLCYGTILGRTIADRKTIDLDAVRYRCQTYLSKEDSYNCLQKIGFTYGESLRLINSAWTSPTECVVELIVPDCIQIETKKTFIHPAIIDGMLQASVVIGNDNIEEGLTFPKGAKIVVLNRPTQNHMFCYSKLMKKTAAGHHFNCLLLSNEGDVIAEIQDHYTKIVKVSETENSSMMYGLTWNHVQVDLSSIGDDNTDTRLGKKLVVFGTSRFLEMFMTLNNPSNTVVFNLRLSVSEMESVYEHAFSQNTNCQAILFAACHNVEHTDDRNTTVYETAKNMFLCLSLLIHTLGGKQYSVPIYVITENVVACPELNIRVSNIFGSELWGLVRSAISESVYPDIRILDMSLSDENISFLNIMTRSDISNSGEYLLHEGKLYTSEFIEASEQDHEIDLLEIERTPAETVTLKSAHPIKIVDPHFQLNDNDRFRANDGSALHTVRLVAIVQHDISIFQTTLESAEPHQMIWPEKEKNGFQVIAIEGIGFLEKRLDKVSSKKVHNTNGQVGFLYPVNVASTVSVPQQCVFDISKLQVYIPGMLITSYVLWNIAQECKHSKNIVLIFDDDGLCTIFENILPRKKRARVVKISKRHLDLANSKVRHSCAYTVVLLTTINMTQVTELQKDVQFIKRIVSVEQFVTISVQRWIALNMKETQIHICHMNDLFTNAKLIKTLPKVHKWMRSSSVLLDLNLNMQAENITLVERNNPFTLPKETIDVDKEHPDYVHIPLKVHTTEVFRKDGCYIVVGGLTGLGWELLQLMAELGAGYLVTFSRRPPADDKQIEINDTQARYGCNIICVQVDITDYQQLVTAMEILQTKIGRSYIRGIFHGGGVLNDKLLINMTHADVEKPLQPKIIGTWNLHLLTKDMPLDFFVMHSSIVSLLGNPGQSNYAAGNSFQDSFAHYRRGKGLCGQSINWSALSVGMATKNKDVESKLRNQGLHCLSREDIRSCFIIAIMTNKVQVTFAIFDWNQLQSLHIFEMNQHKFARLLGKYGKIKRGKKMGNSEHNFNLGLLTTVDKHVQKEMIQTLIKGIVHGILVVEMESLHDETRFVDLGIDSMSSMNFTKSLFEATQVRIPDVTLLSNKSTIGSVTTYIVDNIHMRETPSSNMYSLESKHFDEYLEGNVTFMQKEILREYLKNPRNGEFITQADFEIKGIELSSKDWRKVMNHILNMNPELHRVYTFIGPIFDSCTVPPHKVDVDLHEVPFDSICTENSQDSRDDIIFDLKKELPIKFQIAYHGDITRVRMYIHEIVGDMRSMAMLFGDFATFTTAYIKGEELPDKANKDLLPAEQVRKALLPEMSTMQRFWKQQMTRDIQPFTFAKDFDVPLNKQYGETKETVPHDLAVFIIEFLEKNGYSLFDFLFTAYTLLFHEKTGQNMIPIFTRVDLSTHVPKLATIVTRATNTVPVIGDVRNMGTVKDYMKRSFDQLHEMKKHSVYPYELIKNEIQSDTLRKHINRHGIVMHNRTTLNKASTHSDVAITVKNFYYKLVENTNETKLFVVYDLPLKQIELEFNYKTTCLGHEEATEFPRRLMELMRDLIKHEMAPVTDLLRRPTYTVDVSKGDLENIPPILP